jgi:cytochrome c oxidase assembly factor CtaG
MPGPRWFGTGAKLLYVVAVRFVEAVLANFFIWSGTTLYSPYAHDAVRLWGVDAANDQRLGGVVMFAEGSVVTLVVFGWLFLRWAEESELRQRLLERGLRPAAVDRAIRYRRARGLAAGR